ncbi:MAG TPA: efflux RND transporter periplasmic adaptor subunit, partial [Thermoanaerobaculia bacterium]|nr:efflux RND transporter periplasmic adaptor subunit [Thermoanaerobaculia bacterium]
MAVTKRKKRIALFSGLALALIVVAAFVAMKARGNSNQEPKLPVKIGKAEIADIQVKVTEVGTVEPEVKVDVKSAVSGKVIDIVHREGDVVRRGDILARVEPDLNQAQSLADTKNELSAVRIRYEQATKNFESDHSLFLQGLLATRQNRDSESEYLAAKQDF